LAKYSGSVALVIISGTATSKTACDFVERGDGAKTTAQFMPIWAAISVSGVVDPALKLPITVLVEQSPALVALNCSVVGTEVSIGVEVP
jgi:hypothetical protein